MITGHLIPSPDQLIKAKEMEEKMLGLGLLEMDSSELQIRGGSSFDTIVTKVKYVINFIADYIPKVIKGFADGFAVKIL